MAVIETDVRVSVLCRFNLILAYINERRQSF